MSTNSDEGHVGRASTPMAGLQTRLFHNSLSWIFDRARMRSLFARAFEQPAVLHRLDFTACPSDINKLAAPGL